MNGFALMATSIAYGRCVFGEFQLFSWSWRGEQMFLAFTALDDFGFHEVSPVNKWFWNFR